jgi:hypothetical protein
LQFCDSAKHHGGAKEKAKDAAIDARLAKIGVPARLIPNSVFTRMQRGSLSSCGAIEPRIAAG